MAERVIARDGHGASLEAIALEAGITKPVVYARIGSRAELSDALAGRLAERLLETGRVAVGTSGELDRDTLVALFRTTLETIGTHRELFLYVTRGVASDTPERALYLAGRSAAPLAQRLVHWRTARDRDAGAAVPWAYALVGMLNLVALWWTEEGGVSAEVLAQQLAELVWPGLDGDP